MYIKECPNCKKEFSAKDRRQVCCSRECSNQYMSVTAKLKEPKKKQGPTVEFDGDHEWIKENDGKYACRYNPQGCSCSNRRCLDCGWNPEVAKERLAEIRQKMQEVPV